MFLIDLNHMYVKVVNSGGRVWTHSLDEIEFMSPDDTQVHVRRGPNVLIMPFYIIKAWLWPVGVDMNCESACPMELEFVKRIKRRLLPVGHVANKEDKLRYLPF